MNGDQLIEFTILLGAGMVFVILFRRIGLGAVLGYLIAGAAVGPQGLGWVSGGAEKLAFAELGIALLLFLVGLELSPQRLWRMRREIFGLGLTQVAACALALFAFLLFATGFTWQAVLALALPLALSSTAQVLPSLKSSGRINSPFGERAFSILLFQDLSIVPLITIIAALSRAPADPAAPPGWTLALYTVGAVIGLILAGRFLLTPLLRVVGRIGERELFVVVGLFAVLASAGLMHALHLSVALGAFIAGVMLADSPYRHELEADVEPFRSILLGLFFLAVGMVLDVGVVLDRPLTVIGLAAGLVAIKTAMIWGVARLFGMAWRPALALALLLSQGGEFGFVLFAQAQQALLIEAEAASLFGAVVTLSMATTPFLMLFARFLEYSRSDEQVAADKALDGPDAAPNGQAIVVGYGRFGQIVAQMLHAVGTSVTLIDKKPAQIELSGNFDVKVYYGDGLRLDVLRQAGADQACVIALCTDDRTMTAEQLGPIMHAFPKARLFVRAFDRRQLLALAPLEPAAIVRETFESAMAMALHALAAIDIGPDEIADAERAVRHLDGERLNAQIGAGGDMRAGFDLRFTAEGNQRPREILDRLADRLHGND
jgi:monovalent cation:proton antiporter-2 (CPA2) family protein